MLFRYDNIYAPTLVGRLAEFTALGDLRHDLKTYIKPVIGSERLLGARPRALFAVANVE